MPLSTVILPKPVYRKVKRKVHRLVHTHYFSDLPDKLSPHIAFCANIRDLQLATLASLAAGKPPGFRIFIGTEKGVIAAIDFYYRGNRICFSQLITGVAVERMIAALNYLEDKLILKKQIWKAEFLTFLPMAEGYIIARSATKKEYYRMGSGQPEMIAKAIVKKEIGMLAESKRLFLKTNNHA